MNEAANKLSGIKQIHENLTLAENDPLNAIQTYGEYFVTGVVHTANNIGKKIQRKCKTSFFDLPPEEYERVSCIPVHRGEGRETLSFVVQSLEDPEFASAIQRLIGLPAEESVRQEWQAQLLEVLPLIEMAKEIATNRKLFHLIVERSDAKISKSLNQMSGFLDLIRMADPSDSNPELSARLLTDRYAGLRYDHVEAVSLAVMEIEAEYSVEFMKKDKDILAQIWQRVVLPIRSLVNANLFLERLTQKINDPETWRP